MSYAADRSTKTAPVISSLPKPSLMCSVRLSSWPVHDCVCVMSVDSIRVRRASLRSSEILFISSKIVKGPVQTLALSVPFRVASCCLGLVYVVQLAELVDNGSCESPTLVAVEPVRHSKCTDSLFHQDLSSCGGRLASRRNCNTVLLKYISHHENALPSVTCHV